MQSYIDLRNAPCSKLDLIKNGHKQVGKLWGEKTRDKIFAILLVDYTNVMMILMKMLLLNFGCILFLDLM